jgi:alpha-tubulin suppressor-like RCC1 family protein
MHCTRPLPIQQPADYELVLTWGCGDDGQLGHGDAQTRVVPFVVSDLIGKKIADVVCGAEYTVAISKEEDVVYSWGW